MDQKYSRSLIIVGGGPAGLMAAEAACGTGIRVDIYEAMPSVGRKFLMAGKGGLNLTHADDPDRFLNHFGERRTMLEPSLRDFGNDAVQTWAQGLGVETFVGTSGRIFPREMKAAPLLRAWLRRLRSNGVRFHVRHRWLGWSTSGSCLFETPKGISKVQGDALLLALGGGSWPALGSDGRWIPLLEKRGIPIQPLRPANCGFECRWSPHFQERHAGQPVKPVTLAWTDANGVEQKQSGEFVITREGIEGSLVYAMSASLRDTIAGRGAADIRLDLAPGRSQERLMADLSRPRGSQSLSAHLRKSTGIQGVKAGLLREVARAGDLDNPARLASLIKSLPLRLETPRPLDEAISSAGGVDFSALDDHFMLKACPGLFFAGEMLDWEAPTGGYLLTACFATGRAAGLAASAWLQTREHQPPVSSE